MTFPVSKNLFRDLSSEFNQAMRAKYMLGVVVASYRDFSSRVKLITTAGLTKGDRIGEIISLTDEYDVKNFDYYQR